MKKIFIVALLCAFTCNLKAQITTDPTTGNVGIGTSSPGTKLDVNGPVTINRNWLFLCAPGDFNHAIGNTTTDDGTQFRFFQFLDLYQTTSAVSRFYINGMGNVGIGTTNPGAALSVSNSTPIIQVFDNRSNPTDGSSIGKVAFGSVNGEFASIGAIRKPNNSDDVSELIFKTSFAVGAGGDGNNIERMRILTNGSVGIGTTDTKGYKLAVAGSAIATSFTVKQLANWPDYVFKKGYNLPLLADIKAYINQNHHLPEMPSEKEVKEKGVDLGEMNKLLTKKVEELTLYLIEMKQEKDKEKKDQQKQIDELKKQMLLLTAKH